MKMISFATRNTKEILRDPLNLGFGIGFPVVLLLLFTVIQANAPVSLFEIQSITPGIAVFGLSFITLFSATIISKDRSSSFLCRLYTTPMTPWDFIFGYTLPMLPIAISQCMICYITAIILGLKITVNVLWAVVFSVPVALMFISLGLLCGSVFNDKQVGGLCGALLTNVSAVLSGAWFDLSLVGGVLEKIAYLLPFAHAVDMGRAVLAGDISGIFPHLWWILGYTVIILGAAIYLFMKQMKK